MACVLLLETPLKAAYRCLIITLTTSLGAEEEARYIERVVIHLHPTFRPSTLNLTQPPFAVRCGLGASGAHPAVCGAALGDGPWSQWT